MIGKTFSHYRILEKLGAGGMGVVYRARDEQLQRDVAIKVLPAGSLSTDEARRQFRKEAQMLAQLNHPNIEAVYEFASEADMDFLVMEFVPGMTLAEKLFRGTLPQREIITLGLQIAAALDEAHQRGIIHLDLKPANIALASKGQAKVLDFGLAKFLHPLDESTADYLTSASSVAGTLPYMAPEQLRGETVDGRADIHAVGAVLYEMATGRRAFAEEIPSRLIDAILNQDPPPPRTLNRRLSPELDSIIVKCLDKNPDQRYQSAKELLVDLRRLEQSLTSGGVPFRILPAKVRGRSKRRILTGLAAFTSLALLLFVANIGGCRDRLFGRAPIPQIRSLAVLPFENLSGNPDQDYFADGMTEALITDLGQIQALRVISRTSVMRYKSARKPLSEISRELNVDAVIEGSVSRIDGSALVTARLFYGPTERQLWSKNYRQDLKNVLVLEGEVASEIVSEISLQITPLEHAQLTQGGSVNPDAHEAYLKGNYFLWGTPEQKQKAKAYFERAIQIDPNYAPPYAGLADYYGSSDALPPRVYMPLAEKYAQKAQALDPKLARAYLALGNVSFFRDRNWSKAEGLYRRAIALQPNDAEASRVYSYFLTAIGNQVEAQAEVRRAQELDPLYITTQITAGWVFYFSRQYDRAIEQCKKALELDQDSAGAYDCIGSSYVAKGQYEEAIPACHQAVTISGNAPPRLVGLAQAYVLAGRKTEAQNINRQLRELSQTRYVPPYLFAKLEMALGNKKEALSRLEESLADRDSFLTWMKVERSFDRLRGDPQFEDLLRRAGFKD
jgi:eukaryotic-like serine/threonine-protein kinase